MLHFGLNTKVSCEGFLGGDFNYFETSIYLNDYAINIVHSCI